MSKPITPVRVFLHNKSGGINEHLDMKTFDDDVEYIRADQVEQLKAMLALARDTLTYIYDKCSSDPHGWGAAEAKKTLAAIDNSKVVEGVVVCSAEPVSEVRDLVAHYCNVLDNLGDVPIPNFEVWAEDQWKKGSELLKHNGYFRDPLYRKKTT
jgi:hypothetical protein